MFLKHNSIFRSWSAEHTYYVFNVHFSHFNPSIIPHLKHNTYSIEFVLIQKIYILVIWGQNRYFSGIPFAYISFGHSDKQFLYPFIQNPSTRSNHNFGAKAPLNHILGLATLYFQSTKYTGTPISTFLYLSNHNQYNWDKFSKREYWVLNLGMYFITKNTEKHPMNTMFIIINKNANEQELQILCK